MASVRDGKFVKNPGFAGAIPFVAPLLLLASIGLSQAQPASGMDTCGTVMVVETHDNSTTRYAFVPPPENEQQQSRITVLLLPGGSGHVNLDDKACPRALKGNSLVRSIPIFNASGFGTALLDAPSDFQGEDGLAGFRSASQHAVDIGKVIADLRRRTQGSVWVVGTSRGSISAANAAARLSGPAAHDGVVLTSALMSGQSAAKKTWVAQTVFDLPLEAIRQPLLLIGHAADRCVRSPPDAMEKVTARTRGVRQQVVTIAGGPAYDGPPGINACEGRSPHGFVDQEAEVVAGIARFIRGEKF